LSKYSIETIINLPSVGENLQDQINVLVAGSTNQTFSGYPPFATFVNATDLFGSNTTEVYKSVLSQLPSYAESIAKTSKNALHAPAQEILLRSQIDLIFNKLVPVAEFLTVPNSSPTSSIIGSVFWGLLPFARGSVHGAGENINSPPAINPNFFMMEWDHKLQVAAARLARKSLSTFPLRGLIDVEIVPGAAVPANASNEVWLSWMKGHCIYHFSSMINSY
jgi:choline dehydrogenase